jgi:Flp pilus assembly protein TadB
MITDYYSKTTKTRKKEAIKEQDTPQDKKRLKITPLIQEIQDKEQHRRATTSHRKEIFGYFWLLAIGYWLLAIGYWLLAIGYWLLAIIGYWLLAIGYWLLAIGYCV